MTASVPREIEVALHGAVLDPGGPWRREPPRPPSARQPFYDERFDALTLFYDVFRDGDDVEILGPPLLNLEAGLRPLSLRAAGRRYARGFTSQERNRLHRHRVLGVPAEVRTLRFHSPLGRFALTIGEDMSGSFSGLRVLITQSRDNPLPWIARWIDHHVVTQGIDAVLIYDNGSRDYSLDDLRALLRSRRGLRRFAVVDWPYPWGPTGGPESIWDSDFGQHGSWEHAWRRLCRDAETLTFGDVDELIVGPAPTVPERALASPVGLSSYARRSVLNIPARPTRELGRMRDHADYLQFDPSAPLLTSKYTVAPGALAGTDQLLIHRVEGREAPDEPDVLARHFDGIRIEWRDGERHPVPDQRLEDLGQPPLAVDGELAEALARTDPTRTHPAPSGPSA